VYRFGTTKLLDDALSRKEIPEQDEEGTMATQTQMMAITRPLSDLLSQLQEENKANQELLAIHSRLQQEELPSEHYQVNRRWLCYKGRRVLSSPTLIRKAFCKNSMSLP